MPDAPHPHADPRLVTAGAPLADADSALILVHGRGGTPESLLPLAEALEPGPGTAVLAPAARGNSWYPYSFLQPLERNQPWLDSALRVFGELLAQVEEAGVPAERVVLAGFSQGACLASEYVARNARRYGGLLAFSGGLIGPEGTPRDYRVRYGGDLAGTPAFFGCSDVDAHIPEARVHESAAALSALGAEVTTTIYPGMAHTIVDDEIQRARRIVAGLGAPA